MSLFIKGLALDSFEFRGKLVAISEENLADANFCLSGFMWQAFNNQDTGVLLVALQHSPRHYYHVGMRLGYNLSSNLGVRFATVDAISIQEAHKQGDQVSAKVILELVQNKVSILQKQCKNIFILLDDISNLLNMGVDKREVLLLINYLNVIYRRNTTLVICSHFHEEDVEQCEIKSILMHICDIRINVKALETGFSKDLTGALEISKRTKGKVEGWTEPILYHYRTKERAINIFLPGNIIISN